MAGRQSSLFQRSALSPGTRSCPAPNATTSPEISEPAWQLHRSGRCTAALPGWAQEWLKERLCKATRHHLGETRLDEYEPLTSRHALSGERESDGKAGYRFAWLRTEKAAKPSHVAVRWDPRIGCRTDDSHSPGGVPRPGGRRTPACLGSKSGQEQPIVKVGFLAYSFRRIPAPPLPSP